LLHIRKQQRCSVKAKVISPVDVESRASKKQKIKVTDTVSSTQTQSETQIVREITEQPENKS